MAQLNEDEKNLVIGLADSICRFVHRELPELPSGVVKMYLVAEIFGDTHKENRKLPISIENEMHMAWNKLFEHVMWGYHNDEP